MAHNKFTRALIFTTCVNMCALISLSRADDSTEYPDASDGGFPRKSTPNLCEAKCGTIPDPASFDTFKVGGVATTSTFVQCSLGRPSREPCVLDLWKEANLTSYLEASNSTHMVEMILKCSSSQQIVDLHTPTDKSFEVTSRSPAFWIHVYHCVLPWQSLSHFSERVNVTVINAFFSDYSVLNFSTDGVNPNGFNSIGTIGALRVTGGDYLTKGLTSFYWPALAEFSFFNTTVHNSDFPDNMRTTMPNLQSIELEYVQLTAPLVGFPWQPNPLRLPNGLRRTHFFNDRHYARGMRVPPGEYRRVQRVDFSRIRNLTGVTFGGFLHKLSLKGNLLRDIPSTLFSEMTGLQSLDLSNNSIKQLPCGLFRNVTGLMELNLGQNSIEELRVGLFSELSDLQTLHLEKNNIRAVLRGHFTGLRNLERLNLEYNAIDYIEKAALTSETSKLKFVFLKGNRLTSFPVALFVNLISLDLSHNFISFDSFNETLEQVSYKDIEQRNINSVSDANYLEGRATTKTLINLQHNSITTLNLETFTETQFRSFASILNYFAFDLSANKFVCDCKVFALYRFMRNPVKTIRSPQSSTILDVRIDTADFSTWKCSSPPAVADLPISFVPNTTFECVTKMAGCPRACDCLLRSVDHSVTVKCDGRKLKALPEMMPDSKNELVLHVEDNFLESIEQRDYLRNVTKLYASRNNISSIPENALKSMKKLRVLHVDSNKLTTLPRYIENMTERQLASLNVKHNFFDCDCHSLWKKYWLRKSLGKVVEAQNVLCAAGGNKGKVVIYVPDHDFTCELLAGEVAAIALAASMAILIVAFAVAYTHRQEVKVLLYAKFNWHPFDNVDHDSDEGKIYDAFISYCSKDYRFVCHNMRTALEQNEPPYKLCIHDRDFLVGAPIYENVMNSVKLSKRMIMILSEDFLRSEWCMVEFRTAHQKVLKEHSRYLIVILLGDVDATNLDEDLQLYLKTNTYLAVDDKLFWERLRYSLPKPTPGGDVIAADELTRV